MRMKIPTAGVLLTTVLSAGCANAGEVVQYPAPNLGDDTYQPGPNWSLAWSDEFEGDTIDATNWSFQVVEAGRFNDEWQRYTDSNQNAYVAGREPRNHR